MVLAGCGGDGSDTSSEKPADKPSAQGLDRASLAQCLDEAGVEVRTTGKLPIMASVKGIGIRLDDSRPLQPGDLSAAVFVLDSRQAAQDNAESLEGFAGEVSTVGRVVVMWGNAPDRETLSAVRTCVQP